MKLFAGKPAVFHARAAATGNARSPRRWRHINRQWHDFNCNCVIVQVTKDLYECYDSTNNNNNNNTADDIRTGWATDLYRL